MRPPQAGEARVVPRSSRFMTEWCGIATCPPREHRQPGHVPPTTCRMQIMRATASILMLFLVFGSDARGEELQWSRYSNPQLRVGVDIPTGLFSVDAGAVTSGRTFKTSDGRANLSIYAIDNEAGETPGALCDGVFSCQHPRRSTGASRRECSQSRDFVAIRSGTRAAISPRRG